MRVLTLIILLTFFSCKESNSTDKKIQTAQTQNRKQAEKIALEFINNYVEFCNNNISQVGILEWVSDQPNISEKFKIKLTELISQEEKQDAELGLDFDPIFDAQDYPDNGFELQEFDKEPGFIIVKGKDWNKFKLKIKMKLKNGQWMVNGIGIINMSEKERIKR